MFVASSCPSTIHKLINAHHDSAHILKCLWMNNRCYSSLQNQDMLTAVTAMLNHIVLMPCGGTCFEDSGLSIPIHSCHFNHISFPPSQHAPAPTGLVVYFSTSFIPLWYVSESESQCQQIWMQSARILSGLRVGTYPTHYICSQRHCLLGTPQYVGLLSCEWLLQSCKSMGFSDGLFSFRREAPCVPW